MGIAENRQLKNRQLDRLKNWVACKEHPFQTDNPRVLPNGILLDLETGALNSRQGDYLGYLQSQELTFLMIHLGKVLSTHEVVEIWRETTGEIFKQNTIEVHRSNVRNILGIEFETPRGNKIRKARKIRQEYPKIKRRELERLLKDL